MKPLVLLSFSLTFLSQGIANDFSDGETNEKVRDEKLPLASEPLQNVFSNREKTKEVWDEEFDDNQDISVNDEDNLFDVEQPFAPMPSFSTDQPQEWCLSPYHRMHGAIRHNESRGIGYNDGYTTLEAFGIYDGYGSSFMPFVDLRGHVFNNGKLAGNLGLGERTYLSSIDHIFGSYLYYDVRRVGHGLTVNQLSPGVELVGERMEYRINGYFPIGEQKGRKYGYAFDKFDGHSIILKLKQNQAMRGFDAEAGIHLTQSTKYDLYAAAGPYYFRSSNAFSWGGRTRLLGRYKEYVSLEVAYSYDHLFCSVVEGSVALTLPFGRKLKRCGQCCPQTNNLLLSRAAFAPSRFEIPVVKKIHKRETAINPATGDPWTVWFVNNTSHSAGTFESPFTTIAAASASSSPNDMIYVFPGHAQYNEAIVLKDGQDFFGSGVKQHFSTTKGTIAIPAMSRNNPSITNSAGSVVTLGNGNVVSGFNVSASAGLFGIGSSSNVINATVANNVITLSTAGLFGVSIPGFGTVTIYNNQLSSPAPLLTGGIFVMASGGTMSGRITNNFTSGLFLPIGLSAPPANPGSYDFTIQENTITEYGGQGISVVMLGTSTVNITGNTLSTHVNLAGTAIKAIDDPSTISGRIMIQNNQVAIGAANDFFGIEFSAANAKAWNLKAVVTNNSVQGVDVGTMFAGYGFMLANTDTLCLSLNNNTYTNSVAGSTAFSFNATAGKITIDSIEENVGGPVSCTGNVNLVPAGTCSP